MQDLNNIIESLLFVAEEPLTVEKLRNILETVDSKEIRSTLQELADEYDQRGGGFRLREVAGGWQMRSRPEYHEWIKRMLQPSPQRLSRAALETLAVVAYKQPIIRADIEHIRGVDCGGVLRQLMERKLIRVLGRKEIAGRPLIYATTKLFLEMFDLKGLNDLPTPKEIAEFGNMPADSGDNEDNGSTNSQQDETTASLQTLAETSTSDITDQDNDEDEALDTHDAPLDGNSKTLMHQEEASDNDETTSDSNDDIENNGSTKPQQDETAASLQTLAETSTSDITDQDNDEDEALDTHDAPLDGNSKTLIHQEEASDHDETTSDSNDDIENNGSTNSQQDETAASLQTLTEIHEEDTAASDIIDRANKEDDGRPKNS